MDSISAQNVERAYGGYWNMKKMIMVLLVLIHTENEE